MRGLVDRRCHSGSVRVPAPRVRRGRVGATPAPRRSSLRRRGRTAVMESLAGAQKGGDGGPGPQSAAARPEPMLAQLLIALLSTFGLAAGPVSQQPQQHSRPSGPCFSQPSSCGYPDATNTGVPAGTSLSQLRQRHPERRADPGRQERDRRGQRHRGQRDDRKLEDPHDRRRQRGDRDHPRQRGDQLQADRLRGLRQRLARPTPRSRGSGTTTTTPAPR